MGRFGNSPEGLRACAADSSCCRPAVRRAYDGIKASGQPERYALEAALTVFRWHHPEVPHEEAERTVSEWVWSGVAH
jgi:hypothetical protein